VAPARQSPARRAWRDSELKRWAKVRGLPVTVPPKHWPVPGALASRVVIAAQDLGLDVGALSSRILRAVWADDLDISDAETVGRLVAEVLPDAAPKILEMAATDAAAYIFDTNTNEAIGKGVIGSPTFIVDDEMLFGQDRLGFLAEKLGVA